MVVEQAQGCAPEDVGVEPLLSVLVLEGLLPVERRELEDPANRPVGGKAEEIAKVGPGLDVVELATREQGDEVALISAASSVPTNNQFFLPTASRRNARSEPLLWMGSRPSSRKRWRATR
jgi:hypothetical protein